MSSPTDPLGAECAPAPKPASVEKSGGNVNYYVANIPDPKRLPPYKAECEDIIEALGMNFAEGCLFKALWRSCAARTLALHKEGQDLQGIYDAEKAVYYANRVLAIRKRIKPGNQK
jgi:hypothetical protein